jgi:hypothetical protein
MGLTASAQVKNHARFLSLRPDEQTVYRGMPETAQALFLKLTKLQREWFPLEGSFREQFEYLTECTETEFAKRRRLASEQAREEAMAKWEAEHPPEQYIEAFRAGLASSEQFRVQVAAELTGEVAARESMLSEAVRAQAVAVFAGVEGLGERLASDDQFRGEIAGLIALEWFDDVPAADVVTAPVDEPAPEPELEKDKDVELIRMGPSVAKDVPGAAEDQPVPEPGPEPELPPVEDAVVQAARKLGIQVWNGVSVPRAQLAPANDQALTHAVHMEWLAAAGALVVRGGVDPRPVMVTRIPN